MEVDWSNDEWKFKETKIGSYVLFITS
jgi:hypothetical protein